MKSPSDPIMSQRLNLPSGGLSLQHMSLWEDISYPHHNTHQYHLFQKVGLGRGMALKGAQGLLTLEGLDSFPEGHHLPPWALDHQFHHLIFLRTEAVYLTKKSMLLKGKHWILIKHPRKYILQRKHICSVFPSKLLCTQTKTKNHTSKRLLNQCKTSLPPLLLKTFEAIMFCTSNLWMLRW